LSFSVNPSCSSRHPPMRRNAIRRSCDGHYAWNWEFFRVPRHITRERQHLGQILASRRAAPMKELREAIKRSAAHWSDGPVFISLGFEAMPRIASGRRMVFISLSCLWVDDDGQQTQAASGLFLHEVYRNVSRAPVEALRSSSYGSGATDNADLAKRFRFRS